MRAQEEIDRERSAIAAANLQIWAMALDIVAALGERGIPVMVIKSLPQVEDLYGTPGGRYTADVDVLVPADRAEAAILIAIELGWKVLDHEWSGLPPAGTERAQAISRRFWHLQQKRNGVVSALDVHTDGMDPWRKRVLDAGIWRRAIPEERDGVRFLLPGPEDRLLFLCWHFFSDSTSWGMQWDKLTDIALILLRPGEIDWRYMVERARDAGVVLPLLLACELAAERSSIPIQPQWRDFLGRTPWRFYILWPVLRRYADSLYSRQRLLLWFLMQDDVTVMIPEWRRRFLPGRSDLEADAGHVLSGPEYLLQLVQRYLKRLRHPAGW